MIDEESHLALSGPVNNAVKDVFDGIGGHKVHGEAVQLGCPEGVHNLVAIVVQLAGCWWGRNGWSRSTNC